jgi:hypothetical protein
MADDESNSTAALVQRYARGFDAAMADGTHGVWSPLGAWLLLALVAAGAPDPEREHLAEVFGADVDEVVARARALLEAPHPAVATAVALWHDPTAVRPSFADWDGSCTPRPLARSRTGRRPTSGHVVPRARSSPSSLSK